MVTRLSKTAHSNFRRDAALYMSGKYADELTSGETWVFECDKHGKFRAYVPAGKNWSDYVVCPICVKEGCLHKAEAEKKEAFEDKFRKIVAVPEDNAFASFDQFEVRTESPEVEKMDKYVLVCLKSMCGANDLWDRCGIKTMLICGKTGVGKSYLGVSFLRQRFTQQCSCKYILDNELNGLVTSVWKNSAQREDLRKHFESYDCLVVDDVDPERWLAMRCYFLAELIVSRHSKLKQTVLLTNRTKEDIFSGLGSAVESRIRSGRAITLSGEDRRKTRKLREASVDAAFQAYASGL